MASAGQTPTRRTLSHNPTALEQVQYRTCRGCGDSKPHSEYYSQRGCRDGIRPTCRSCDIKCSNTAALKWRKNNPEKYLWTYARSRARTGGIPFSITPDDISIPERCPVLGIRLQSHTGSPGGRPSSPSLDRIIPERGYVPGNVEVISWRANSLKKDATLEELEALVDYLARRVPPKQTRRKTRNPA